MHCTTWLSCSCSIKVGFGWDCACWRSSIPRCFLSWWSLSYQHSYKGILSLLPSIFHSNPFFEAMFDGGTIATQIEWGTTIAHCREHNCESQCMDSFLINKQLKATQWASKMGKQVTHTWLYLFADQLSRESLNSMLKVVDNVKVSWCAWCSIQRWTSPHPLLIWVQSIYAENWGDLEVEGGGMKGSIGLWVTFWLLMDLSDTNKSSSFGLLIV